MQRRNIQPNNQQPFVFHSSSQNNRCNPLHRQNIKQHTSDQYKVGYGYDMNPSYNQRKPSRRCLGTFTFITLAMLISIILAVLGDDIQKSIAGVTGLHNAMSSVLYNFGNNVKEYIDGNINNRANITSIRSNIISLDRFSIINYTPIHKFSSNVWEAWKITVEMRYDLRRALAETDIDDTLQNNLITYIEDVYNMFRNLEILSDKSSDIYATQIGKLKSFAQSINRMKRMVHRSDLDGLKKEIGYFSDQILLFKERLHELKSEWIFLRGNAKAHWENSIKYVNEISDETQRIVKETNGKYIAADLGVVTATGLGYVSGIINPLAAITVSVITKVATSALDANDKQIRINKLKRAEETFDNIAEMLDQTIKGIQYVIDNLDAVKGCLDETSETILPFDTTARKLRYKNKLQIDDFDKEELCDLLDNIGYQFRQSYKSHQIKAPFKQ